MSFADEIPCLGDSLKSETLKPKSLGLKMAAGCPGSVKISGTRFSLELLLV